MFPVCFFIIKRRYEGNASWPSISRTPFSTSRRSVSSPCLPRPPLVRVLLLRLSLSPRVFVRPLAAALVSLVSGLEASLIPPRLSGTSCLTRCATTPSCGQTAHRLNQTTASGWEEAAGSNKGASDVSAPAWSTKKNKLDPTKSGVVWAYRKPESINIFFNDFLKKKNDSAEQHLNGAEVFSDRAGAAAGGLRGSHVHRWRRILPPDDVSR